MTYLHTYSIYIYISHKISKTPEYFILNFVWLFSIFYAVTVYVNSSIFPKKLIKHLTCTIRNIDERSSLRDPMTFITRSFLVILYENFGWIRQWNNGRCTFVQRSEKIVKRTFVHSAIETRRRWRDGYGVPYGLAYQRGRGTRTSRVPLISRQHAPLIISLITATWTRRGPWLDQRQHRVGIELWRVDSTTSRIAT